MLDPPLRHLLAIDEQGSGCALANAPAVIVEDKANDVVTGSDRLIGNNAIFVLRLVRICVGEGGLAER